MSQLRKVAVQGLESIRLIGNHGIDVQLMVYLAKNFERQVLHFENKLLVNGEVEKTFNFVIQLL